jgi:hypothetical protein
VFCERCGNCFGLMQQLDGVCWSSAMVFVSAGGIVWL